MTDPSIKRIAAGSYVLCANLRDPFAWRIFHVTYTSMWKRSIDYDKVYVPQKGRWHQHHGKATMSIGPDSRVMAVWGTFEEADAAATFLQGVFDAEQEKIKDATERQEAMMMLVKN